MPLSPETREAVRRYGPSINRLARRRYGVSGQDLLAKLVMGESGDDPNAVSPAGARGRTQFMPSSRQEAIRKYGVDPWGSADDAVRAAVLHLKGKINGTKGLEGYNPGDPNYASYILGQPVRGPGGRSRAGGGQQTPSGTSPTLLPPSLSVQPGPDTSGLLASLLTDKPAAPPTGSLRPSPTAAAPALPQGYRGIQSAGGPAPRRDISTLLEAVSGLGTGLPGVTPGQVVGDAENGRDPRKRPRTSKVGGGLRGAVNLVDTVIGSYGAPITAKQEPGHTPGGDHDPAVKGATARDIGGDEATRKRIFSELMERLGVEGATYKGPDVNVTRGGVRYQIISRDHGTGPHLHVGIRRTR
jgi:hypothetical protein